MQDQANALFDEIKDFSVSTGITAKVFNSDGVEMMSFGSCPECELCRLVGCPRSECDRTHKKAGEDTLRFGGKYIYLCPMGFVYSASPVLTENSEIVTAAAGPILIIGKTDYFNEYIRGKDKLSPETVDAIRSKLDTIHLYSLDQVTAYSNMLYYLASYSSGKDAVKLLNSEKENTEEKHGEEMISFKNGFTERTEYPLFKEKELLEVMSVGDRKNAQRLLNEILGYIFFATGGDTDVIKTRVAELIVQLSRTAALNGGVNRQKIMEISVEYMKTIWTLESVDDISAWMSRILSSFTQMVFSTKDIKHLDVIQKVVSYINANYMNKISLDDIAREGFLSSSYLSKLFKSEMKINLSTYINNVRVEKSKLLLLDETLSIMDVATMVGFEEQSYFSKVFRNVTGVSPGKFRQLKGHI
ncbi:MAG: helix-turn-helix domain-containing protein [Clostridia bacterium]|nr:helix-turn-helix domain-containing protein [Clostridia bacterium]